MAQIVDGTAVESAPCYVAPSKISVNASSKRIGKGVFAGADFKGGELITAVKRPLLASLESERLIDTCSNCFVWTGGSSAGSRLYVKEGTTVQTCARCKRFRYCSKECQKEAWNRGHKHECKNLKVVGGKEMPKAVLGCMELLVRRKHGLISDGAWEMLCQLDSHIKDFKKNGRYGGIELMALGTSQFSFTLDTFSKDFVAAMYATILSNSMTLVTPTFDPLGIMIDPMLSYINHSCDPNAYIVMDGPTVELRTLKDISKDEEIYISYIDNTNPMARRQFELKERWFFDCTCSECQRGQKTWKDEWATEPKKLENKHKNVADVLIKQTELAKDPANYAGDSLNERRVAALQGEAFRLYEKQQQTPDPTEAIKIIEQAMNLCRQSRLWPIYRQPMPALRDDLIVNLLAAGKYEKAWAHAAKRHLDVIPKLYPPNHPIPVVQTWQMAMLAQYLASTGTSDMPGNDMAVMTVYLIRSVATMSKTTHGNDSAFSKSVREKYEEVEAQLTSILGSKSAVDAALDSQAELLRPMGNWVEY